MNPERWRRVKELYARALELPPGERRAFLEQACAGDAELLREALALLAAATPPGFLEPPGSGEEAGAPGVLGDFELLEELGRGGMGVVYRSRQLSLQRDVALKLLPPGSALEPRHVERFRREALAAAKLQHPAIVPIHSVGLEGGVHYFAMELVDGHSLNEEIERLRSPAGARAGQPGLLPDFAAPAYIARVAGLCATVADALHHAHEHGVVHRDVKPHNVLLDRAGEPHVVDFGLAKVEELGSISRPGDIAGTPHYMSPEQALAKRVQIDHRTDIFSLGVVLYELLTLQRPFQGKTSNEVLYALSFREPRPLRRLNPRVPRDLDTICEKALAKQPEGRFATAGEFAADLRRFLGHEAIHARRPAAWTRIARHVRRRRNWYLPSAAAALLLAGALAITVRWIERREVAQQLRPLRELVADEDWGDRAVEELVAGLDLVRRLRARGVPDDVEERWLAPAAARIEAAGRERMARGIQRLERGLPSPRGTPIADYRPGSDTDYFQGLRLLQEARLILPGDEELARRADVRLTFPQLEIVAPPELAGAEVYLRTIDWLTQELGEPELLGRLPLAGARPIEPGLYRIAVVRPGAHAEPDLCEFTRLLDQLGRRYTLRPGLRDRARVLAGMCLVPAGDYPVGNPLALRQFRARAARLSAFWIDAAEVTNAEYRVFVEAAGRPAPRSWSGGYRSGWDEKPVVGLSFDDAQAYAEWAGKRLPTWFEWDAAARGPQGFRFPWGDAAEPAGDVEAAAQVERSPEFESWAELFSRLHAAGDDERDRSPFGLWDVLGNAWEWTESLHAGTTQEGEPYADLGARIVKGYYASSPEQRPLYENTACPVIGEDRIGFRCATSVWSR